MLAVISLAGAGLAAGALAVPHAAAVPPSLNSLLTETWNTATAGTILNDAPCGIAQASPVLFDDGGTSAVEVGDRQGSVYGLNLQTGSVVAGWGSGTGSTIGSGQGCANGNPGGGMPATGVNGTEVPGSPPIDSTASVSGNGNLSFGGGNAASPVDGGYFAYTPNGAELWNQVATNPASDPAPDGGVQASLPIADGGSLVEGGSLGQTTYALNSASGAPATGWPQFSADSVFSTAAVGDLYSTGSDNFVAGGASSNGFAYGTHYSDGGHVRIYNDHGGVICSANTNEEIDSSPAVGPILPGGAYGIATGTGSFFGGSDENTVKVFDTQCNQVWSTKLDGTTGGSPALANIQNNGQLAVLEGTVHGSDGSVWALNAATGAPIWHTDVGHPVYGSVTTADLTGSGYQDVIVPTDKGVQILDGQTGATVANFDDGSGNAGVPPGKVFGFQNAPLVTADPNGSIGITLAGYFAIPGPGGDVQGIVQHFEVTGSLRRARRRSRQLAPVPPRRGLEWFRRRREPPRPVPPAPGGAERVPHRRLRRRDLRLRTGLLRQHREHRAEQTGCRHGGGPRPGRVLAGGLRRRSVRLRRRRVLRLDRVAPSERSRGGHGGHARRQGLLARRVRRRHLHLRRRRVLRLCRVRTGSGHRRDGRHARRPRLLGGRARRVRCSPSATPPSPATPRSLHLNGPSSASRPTR